MANVNQESEQQAPDVKVEILENPDIQQVEINLELVKQEEQVKQEDELGEANIQIGVLEDNSQNADADQDQDELGNEHRGATPQFLDIEVPLEYVNGIIRPIPIRPRHYFAEERGEFNLEALFPRVQNLSESPPPMFAVPMFQPYPQSSNNVTYNFIFPPEVIRPIPMINNFPVRIEERLFEAGYPNWHLGMGIPGWDDFPLYSPPPPPDPF